MPDSKHRMPEWGMGVCSLMFMVRIATCGHITCEDDDIISALKRCASRHGAGDVSVVPFESPIDLIDACADASAEEPFDLVIVPQNLTGLSGVQLATELRAADHVCSGPPVYLCASSGEYAYDAHEAGAAGYLIEPITDSGLDQSMGAKLEKLARAIGSSMVLHCRDRTRRIPFANVLYVETSGHDQAIHLLDGNEPCVVRSSSNALFALLAEDGRFFKVGSSYIVNMDYVSALSTRAGVATLTGGVQIPVPVRLRKGMSEALCDHGAYVI